MKIRVSLFVFLILCINLCLAETKINASVKYENDAVVSFYDPSINPSEKEDSMTHSREREENQFPKTGEKNNNLKQLSIFLFIFVIFIKWFKKEKITSS